MSGELGLFIALVVVYLCGMLQTVNAIRFYSSMPYFDREDGLLRNAFGPCLGLLLWPIIAVALWFMYRAEKKREKP